MKKKVLKIAAISIGSLVALVIVLMIAIPYFFKDKIVAAALDMANENLYSYHLSLLFTISTDIAQCEGSSNTSFREIPTNSHNPNTSQIRNTWQKLYSSIYDANDFIEIVSARKDGWSSGNRELAEIYLGEARALRALFYFELVRWYGNVVLMLSLIHILPRRRP